MKTWRRWRPWVWYTPIMWAWVLKSLLAGYWRKAWALFNIWCIICLAPFERLPGLIAAMERANRELEGVQR